MNNKIYNIVGKKNIFFTISLLIIALSIVLTFVLGMNVAIEFKGGTIVTYSYVGTVNENDIAAKASEVSGQPCNVTLGESLADSLTTVAISFPASEGLSVEVQSAVTDALTAAYPENAITLYSSQDVNPSTGSGFFGKCIMAVAVSAVLMILYIGIRFRHIGGWVAGCCAVIALIHDMFFVYACCVVFRFDINSNFMAVLLTILGYSINATIIIYDRIRENRRLYGEQKSLGELVNMSITQSMGRSIHTTATTVIAMAAICIISLIAGVDSIISFAFPLVVGLLAGVYSSNCIAPNLWVLLQSKIDAKKAK